LFNAALDGLMLI